MYNFISLMKRQNPSNTPGAPLCTVHFLATVPLVYLTLDFPMPVKLRENNDSWMIWGAGVSRQGQRAELVRTQHVTSFGLP